MCMFNFCAETENPNPMRCDAEIITTNFVTTIGRKWKIRKNKETYKEVIWHDEGTERSLY